MRTIVGAVLGVSMCVVGAGAQARDAQPPPPPRAEGGGAAPVVTPAGAPAVTPTLAPSPEQVQAQANVAVPRAESVKAVWAYYFHGKGGGPVLADAKLCAEVPMSGPNRHECVREAGGQVKVGAALRVWQAYLVPSGDRVEDLTVQLKLGDVVRETRDVVVRGDSMRSRTWTDVRFPKPGKWTVTLARGGQTLKTFEVVATK
jgi:hypothetical protein